MKAINQQPGPIKQSHVIYLLIIVLKVTTFLNNPKFYHILLNMMQKYLDNNLEIKQSHYRINKTLDIF